MENIRMWKLGMRLFVRAEHFEGPVLPHPVES